MPCHCSFINASRIITAHSKGISGQIDVIRKIKEQNMHFPPAPLSSIKLFIDISPVIFLNNTP